jgi:hypothetical protein
MVRFIIIALKSHQARAPRVPGPRLAYEAPGRKGSSAGPASEVKEGWDKRKKREREREREREAQG